MQRLACPTCGNEVFFDSLRCVPCGTALAFEVAAGGVLVIGDAAVLGSCSMRERWQCNWRPDGVTCTSCRIVDAGEYADNALLVPFLASQQRALAQLSVLGIDWTAEGRPPAPDLRFTYRSTGASDGATIGHLGGLIILDVDEADPVTSVMSSATSSGSVSSPPTPHASASSARCSATRPPTTPGRSTPTTNAATTAAGATTMSRSMPRPTRGRPTPSRGRR